VTRTGRYKLQILLAGIVGVFGMYLLTRLNAGSPFWAVVVDMIVLGVGIGAVMPVLVVVVANAFPYRLMGMVDSTQQFVRSLGGIIALPVLGTVLNNTFASDFSRSMPETLKLALSRLPQSEQGVLLDPQGLINAASQTAIKSQFTQLGQGGAVLYQQFIETLRNSLSTGVTHLFTLGMVFMLLGVLAALFLPEIRLQLDEFFES